MPRTAKSAHKKKVGAPKKEGGSKKGASGRKSSAKKSQKKEDGTASVGRPLSSSPGEKDVVKKEEKDPDIEPWDLGATILVRWTPDGSARLCQVIERSEIDEDDEKEEEKSWRYYVHYIDFNRRMDEWVQGDRLLAKPSLALSKAKEIAIEAAAAAAAAAAALVAIEGDVDTSGDTKMMTEEDEAKEGEEDEVEGVQLVVEGYEHTAGSGALDFGNRRKAISPEDGGEEAAAAEKESRKRRRSESIVAENEVIPRLPSAVTTANDMEHDEHEGLDEASLKEHEEVTKVKNIGKVELGRHLMDTWYFSPYPKEIYPKGYTDTLYVSEFTFAFFRHKTEFERYRKRHPDLVSPPGDEIYRHDGLAMFEVDGNQDTEFCQNLCYFAKLFLDHKTLYFDVDPFLFYVLTEYDQYGYHPVGYYSKEKYSEVGYNLACILTFPPYQRKGYGRFLIAFSYALSRKEGKVGAPEKPLSDLGHVSYRSYWSSTLVHHIHALLFSPLAKHCSNAEKNNSSSSLVRAISIMELSKATSIMADDVIATLQYLGLIRCINGTYILWASRDVLDKLALRYPVKSPVVNTEALHWAPYVNFDIKRDKFSIRAKKPTPVDPSLVD